MATRTKTIMYAFPTRTTLVGDAILTALTQITVFIPEASPTFVSAFVDVAFQDVVTATGGTITEYRVALSLGGLGATTVTDLNDITNTGEQVGGIIGPFDFTNHFVTNWSGTSMSCDLSVYFDQSTGTTLGMQNVNAVLYITYSYNDTAATQIKTVAIPFESLAGAFGTTAATVATIPQLTGGGGYLPEAGVNIRDWFISIEGNTMMQNTTTDFTLNTSYDGGAASPFAATEGSLASDIFTRWIDKETTPPATNTTHTLQVWTAGIGRLNHAAITLYVTYEFTLSGTTRTLNSVYLPWNFSGRINNQLTDPGGNSTASVKYKVIEPGTITLRNSAFRFNFDVGTTVATIVVSVTGQATARTYTSPPNTACGNYTLQHRFDSGSALGAYGTLARGDNTFTLSLRTTQNGTEATALNGYVLLNYESSVSADGIGAHNHTIFKLLRQFTSLAADTALIPASSSTTFTVPTTYYVNSLGYWMNLWDANNPSSIQLIAGRSSPDLVTNGQEGIYDTAVATDAEIGCRMHWFDSDDKFFRYSGDTLRSDRRLNPAAQRGYVKYSPSNSAFGLCSLITISEITFSVAGSISGHDTGLPTTLRLVNTVTGEIDAEQTLSAGTTAFTFNAFNDTDPYFVQAFQTGSLVGSSAIGKAE
jgi:hypothetical protein